MTAKHYIVSFGPLDTGITPVVAFLETATGTTVTGGSVTFTHRHLGVFDVSVDQAGFSTAPTSNNPVIVYIDGTASVTDATQRYPIIAVLPEDQYFDAAIGTRAAPGDNMGTATSVTGNVGGNVVGSVASVTGNVGGNVTGSVASVTGAVGSVTGNVGGNVVGTVASVVGNVGGNVSGNVSGSTASVTGNVGGNVTGSVGSVASGGITAASIASAAITAAKFAAGAIDANALATDAVTEINAAVLADTTAILKVSVGRWKIDNGTNQLTIYDSDDTTPLYVFDLKDFTGAATSGPDIAERVPA